MKVLRILLISFGAFAFFVFPLSLANAAETQKGYLKLKDGVSRHVEYTPAKSGKVTLVLINGLVYNIDRWQPFSANLKKAGYGIVNYDFRGQSFTLRNESDSNKTPAFFTTGLSTTELAHELAAILVQLKIAGPIAVVGLSYGSSIAAEFSRLYPKAVTHLIIMSPLVRALSSYDANGAWLNWNLDQIKLWWGPFLGPAFYEAAYTQIYKTYLGERVDPSKIPPEMRDRPEVYKQSLFHLVRAARDFDLRKYHYENLPTGSVHFLLGAEPQQAIFTDQQLSFEAALPAKRGALIYMPQAGHAIPDTDGTRAAAYVDLLLKKDSRIAAGRKYQDSSRGLVPWK